MDKNPKIYNQSIECMLVGYSSNSTAYRCWDYKTGHIHVTRNVAVGESQDMIPWDLHPSITAKIDEPDDEDDLPITSNPDPSTTTSEM